MSSTSRPPSDSQDAGSVLVVDDHELVLKAVVSVLTSEGLQVIATQSGQEALDKVSHDSSISCVLLDLSMPAMSGEAVLEKLATLRPELPVLVYSAHEELEVAHRIDYPNVAGYWQKPFSPKQLIEQLQTLIASKTT